MNKSGQKPPRATRLLWKQVVSSVFVMLAAGTAMPEQVTGSVAGVVRDDAGRPVKGVEVALGDYRATTDAAGAFSITQVTPKDYVLFLGPPPDVNLIGEFFSTGDLRSAVKITVRSAQVTRVSRTMQRAGQLEAMISPSPPQSVPLVRPSLSRGDGAVFLPDPRRTGSGFLFWGLETRADYVLDFEPMGYRRQTIRAVAVAAGQTTRVSLLNDPSDPTGLAGTLTSAQGKPMATVLILAVLESDSETRGMATTDADGRFAIVGLPPGNYKVEALGSAHAPSVRTTVVADRRTPVELTWPE